MTKNMTKSKITHMPNGKPFKYQELWFSIQVAAAIVVTLFIFGGITLFILDVLFLLISKLG